MGRKWWEIGFLGCSRAIFGAPRLKISPSYRQKRAEGPFKVPCCGSSPIVVVVWRYLLDYDPGARTHPIIGDQFSVAGTRNGSETAKVTAENAKLAKGPFKAPCCGHTFDFHASHANF